MGDATEKRKTGGEMLSELMGAAAGLQANHVGPGLEIPWATLDGWVQTLSAVLERLEAAERRAMRFETMMDVARRKGWPTAWAEQVSAFESRIDGLLFDVRFWRAWAIEGFPPLEVLAEGQHITPEDEERAKELVAALARSTEARR